MSLIGIAIRVEVGSIEGMAAATRLIEQIGVLNWSNSLAAITAHMTNCRQVTAFAGFDYTSIFANYYSDICHVSVSTARRA